MDAVEDYRAATVAAVKEYEADPFEAVMRRFDRLMDEIRARILGLTQERPSV